MRPVCERMKHTTSLSVGERHALHHTYQQFIEVCSLPPPHKRQGRLLWGIFLLVTTALTLLTGPPACASVTLSADNSEIVGTMSGQYGVAFQTVAPFPPTVYAGRFFDSASGYNFNGGSFIGG